MAYHVALFSHAFVSLLSTLSLFVECLFYPSFRSVLAFIDYFQTSPGVVLALSKFCKVHYSSVLCVGEDWWAGDVQEEVRMVIEEDRKILKKLSFGSTHCALHLRAYQRPSRPIHLNVHIAFDPGKARKGVLVWCMTSLRKRSV